VPLDFIWFGTILFAVAVFHRHTLLVAVAGLGFVVTYKFLVTGFNFGPGVAGLAAHLSHEWVILANLFCLLIGFALLSEHFEKSNVPAALTKILPDNWKGGFYLLAIVFVLSGFLDNIAGAIIGGAMARAAFRGKIHIGYLAAIVASANAGGAGSVVGDTTTTMMWIAGISPLDVLHAYIGAGAALIIFGIPASIQQQRYAPMVKSEARHVAVDWPRVAVVIFVLLIAVAINVTLNLYFREWSDTFPFIGASVVVALLLSNFWRAANLKILPEAVKGSVFLLALVLCATFMPVEKLPNASWPTTLGLGFMSSIFDNIPLTALALKQGGYDWGLLAYAVGFGGSMVWFGSSAGVALSNTFPEAKSVWLWLRHGWHVAAAYVVGFVVLLISVGWRP
jgi:Na+/H+ antiporter NhaD/arsenite permease-like protein